ncbi:6825_t:CDS:1 [Dentiscutata heterogama]|uniref:6825_t:CDS:1 n=1 Tax=Dentiscutata heterogama TaxID=1316150 RepID=A0ACA9K4Y9_9GLOM|nr:6825_t:CDS:1 [Dentiscutata heterogama]
MDSKSFVSIEESNILQNIQCNNGITVFIPQGYSPILIHEDDTKQLKIIKEFPELRICVPALIFNPSIKCPQNSFLLFRNEIKDEIIKDNPKIDTRQISKIAGNKWNKLPEYEKSRYKLQSERLKMQYKSKNLKCKYKTRKQNLLKSLSILFRTIVS